MFPQAILFGMTYEQFWEENPQLFWTYGRAYQMKKENEFKENDINAWNIGQYVLLALTQNSHSMFSKQKKEIYPKQPNHIKNDISFDSNKNNKIKEKFERFAISFNRDFKNKNKKEN